MGYLEEKRTPLSTNDIKKHFEISKKNGESHFNTVIKEMQLKFDIIMIGGKQRIDKDGNPYGDPANLYDLVPNHVPKEWLIAPKELDKVSGKELKVFL